MEYTVRNLKQKDLFRLSRILKKLNIKDEIKSLFIDVTGRTEEEKEDALKETGINVIYLLVENAGEAEEELNFFLGDLVGLSAEEYSELDLTDSMKIITEIVSNKEFIGFFKQATA